ncbi:MAG: choice-of-anchor Q domain-containing protein [Chloroflexota bacterium]
MKELVHATSLITRQGVKSRLGRQSTRIWDPGLSLLPIAILLALLVAMLAPTPEANAAAFDVNDTSDVEDAAPGDGNCDSNLAAPGFQCTLRAAIEEANTLAGSDTINLTVSGPYQLTAGELIVAGEIILNGNGETISSGGLSRIFVVDTGGNLSLNEVTLQDGVGDEGGAIHSRRGSLVNIFNSALINNAATNTPASSGGGINNWGGTVNIVNSTISGNRANAGGGGIANLTVSSAGFVFGTINLTHTTITNNTADFDSSGNSGHDGGGVFTFGVLNIKNTIIAGNFDNTPVSSTGTVQPDCTNWWYLTTQAYNLIGDNTGCEIEYPPGDPASYFPSGTPNGNNDFVGTSDSPLDPLLGGLTGSPAYHPLLVGSPAIDKIPAANCTVVRDQPGTVRPQGAACDIGAIEATSAAYTADVRITKSVVPATPVVPGQIITYTLNFSNTGAAVATDVIITDLVPITLTNVSVLSRGVTITDAGVRPGFGWYVEDLSQNEGGIITIHGRINPDLTQATTFTNTATITTSAVDSEASNNEAKVSVTVMPEETEWRDFCVPQRMEITGIGMGDRYGSINPQTLSLADPTSVNWLLAQMAGRYAFSAPTPEQATFTTNAPQSLTLNQPSRNDPHGYTFEAHLQPSSQITVEVSTPGDSYKTPRGLILYGKRATGNAWTSVGKTTNNFVWEGAEDMYTEIITFPPLADVTDLSITAVIIDNDDDTRLLVLEAAAGGVTGSVSEPGPTDGPGLNIVNLMLPQVLTGTSRAMVTLRSPSDNGDSLVLVGLNVSFPCAEPAGAMLHVVPSPATIPLGDTRLLTITVTPGSTEVNGVQVHGRLDPTYLQLVDVRPTGVLPEELDPLAFDPATGEFSYGAGTLGDVITEPFAVLTLAVQAVATTPGTLVEFLDEFPPTDISGPDGSVMSQAQDGLVIITPGSALRGMVDMQGRRAKPSPPWAIPLTVWLTPPGVSAPAHTFNIVTNQNGEFILGLGDIVPGLYDIRLKGNHTLRNLVPNVNLVSDDNHYSFETLLEGDVETVDTFNQILQPDADVLIGSFNRCQGETGFALNADLDESGCVLLPDFGLLSGNFGREGDVIITPTIALLSEVLQPSDSGALLTFNAEEMAVAVNEVVTLMVEIDPNGQPVNSGMVHLRFDPALVEVVDVTFTDHLPLVLAGPSVDNQQGEVLFAAGILGQTLTEKFPIAALSLKVKDVTAGTPITPIDVFTTTDVSGPQGSVLVTVKGITLKAEAPEQSENTIYLPVILK